MIHAFKVGLGATLGVLVGISIYKVVTNHNFQEDIERAKGFAADVTRGTPVGTEVSDEPVDAEFEIH